MGTAKRHMSLGELFGLTPVSERLADFRLMFSGDDFTPPSRYDLTSLRVLQPRIALECWAGLHAVPRRVTMYNLFNRTQTPVEEGWSVRKTQARDFRGKSRTYDSHNGTDFAIPTGVVATAPAPGTVRRVSNEFHRGGLKVLIDHGGGLVTTSGHLGRALVAVGDEVRRGDPIALTGASGVDMVAAFPWNTPHVHFNTWLNGIPIDPFAADGEVSIWIDHNDPRPPTIDDDAPPSDWSERGIDEAIALCLDPELRKTLQAIEDVAQRGAETMFHRNYYPTRFERTPAQFFERRHPREPRMTLPFRGEDYDGIWLPDE